MSNGKFWAKKIIGFIVCGLAIAAIFGLVVMSLWNWVAVDVMGLKVITFWEALGILLLSKILFGGFHKNWKGGPGGRWSPEMKEKWQHMTPEEKEQFKQNWRNKCRTWGRQPNEPTVKND
jgi:hypothetical protein